MGAASTGESAELQFSSSFVISPKLLPAHNCIQTVSFLINYLLYSFVRPFQVFFLKYIVFNSDIYTYKINVQEESMFRVRHDLIGSVSMISFYSLKLLFLEDFYTKLCVLLSFI